MTAVDRPAQIIEGKLTGARFLDDPALQRILACLNGGGEETRIAGGAIRNSLLGDKVSDVDLASTALPAEIIRRARASGIKAVPTGIDHGTVTLVIDGKPFEVTTLRQDIETDGRRAVVQFGRSFEADALRRDFTINALSLDQDGKLHDYVNGLDDITARHVRFIGDPTARIAEDYLRILRLFRMHAAYGKGPIDRLALLAAISGRAGLASLSRERVGAELQKLLVARNASSSVAEMADAGLIGPLIAGVPNAARLAAIAIVEDAQGIAPDAMLRLAALAVLIEEDAERLYERLRLSKAQAVRLTQAAQAYYSVRGGLSPPGRGDLCRLLFLHGRRAAMDAILRAQAHAGATGDDMAWQSAYIFLRDSPVPRLPFTGADMVQRGLPSGPAIGAALKRLQAAWIRAGFPKDPAVLARLLDEALQP